MRIWLVLAATVISAGCSNFAEHGHGGMAEHYYSTLNPVLPDQPLTPQQGLRFEWELLARHLDILVLEGAELCFPASVVQARQLQNRIVRELYGGLEFDAANDIIIQRAALERLESQLDAVKRGGACIPSNRNFDINASQLAAQIYDLLNVDNQFAFNSPEVNPKYMGHLAEAAHLLRDLPQYHLRVTGHADAIGTDNANQKLSLARAKQVKRYLLIFGLSPSRITVAAVGSSDPLFEGNEPQVRLVNRRVSIELIESAPTAPNNSQTDNGVEPNNHRKEPVYRDINTVSGALLNKGGN